MPRPGSTFRSSTSTLRRPTRARAPEHLPELRVALPRRRARAALWRLRPLRPPLPDPAPGRGSSWLADPGSFVEEAAERPLGRSARVLRPAAVHRAARRGRAEHRPRRRDGDRRRPTIDGHPVELSVMDFAFMGGSMGSAVGEKFSRACDSAIERGAPLVSVTSSGGARMQEGILSLMQLPKTVCAVEELHDARLPLISVMAHPTTGGVLASFASPRRRHDRRARRADRLHRPAGRPADDPREAARRLRPRRAEPPLRPSRRHRPATRAARLPGRGSCGSSR